MTAPVPVAAPSVPVSTPAMPVTTAAMPTAAMPAAAMPTAAVPAAAVPAAAVIAAAATIKSWRHDDPASPTIGHARAVCVTVVSGSAATGCERYH
jgi:hypothetical protein